MPMANACVNAVYLQKVSGMQFLFFLIIYPLLWLVSILPFRILYLLSDALYIIIYYLIGYRKKVVRTNLAKALPHLSDTERLKIEKGSYRHLVDMFLEMIKTTTITQREIEKHFRFTNLDAYLELEKKGKSIAVFCGHYASYEWVISMNHHITFKGFAIYKRIANRYFDKVVRDIRSKFGAYLITTKETVSVIEENQRNGQLSVYGFATDQSPKISKIHHWTNFMGIDSPTITGAEMLSKKYDMNIIFLHVRKVRRGYYEATFEVPFENPREVPDYQITDLYMKRLEQQILAAPEYYLWTHKRWKITRAEATK